MCLLKEITYGEFSEFVREKKIHIMYLGSQYSDDIKPWRFSYKITTQHLPTPTYLSKFTMDFKNTFIITTQ